MAASSASHPPWRRHLGPIGAGDLELVCKVQWCSQKSFHMYKSLAEECEAVEEARPPQSGQNQCLSTVLRQEGYAGATLKQGDRRPCVRLKGGSPI
jgi:hypothetical protein